MASSEILSGNLLCGHHELEYRNCTYSCGKASFFALQGEATTFDLQPITKLVFSKILKLLSKKFVDLLLAAMH